MSVNPCRFLPTARVRAQHGEMTGRNIQRNSFALAFAPPSHNPHQASHTPTFM